MRFTRRTTALAAVLIIQGLVVTGPAHADHGPRVETLVEGLESPRGLTVTDDGTVYVVESGNAGDDHCRTEGSGDEAFEICFGTTSGVTRITPGGQVTRNWVSGLPSMGAHGEFVGASDVSVADDGTMYVSVGLGNSAAARDEVVEDFPPAAMFGTVQRVEPNGSFTTVADLAAYEAENNPDGESDLEEGFDSNPDAVLALEDTVYAADAGGNSILAIDRDTDEITLAAVIPSRTVEAPPQFGGGEMPMQAVPTSLVESPDGEIVFGELTGFPFPVGGANVYALGDDTEAEEIATGYTATMDVDFRDGERYVLEFARAGLLTAFSEGDLTGALVRERPDGTRIALLRDVLQVPGGMGVGPDGDIYISNGSVFPGGGSVVRFDPSQAADAATQSACPPDEVAGTSLSDITDTAHEEAITCVAWHDLLAGFANGTFRPAATITRGQLATAVAGLVEAAGGELPEGSGHFSDVDGTTHATAINGLAEEGIVHGFEDGTYRPGAAISRAQATSILVATYEHVTGDELPGGEDAFDDDDGVHEDAIDAASAAGWVNGVDVRTFAPGANIRRDQTASVLARTASTLVDDGFVSLPS